MWVRSWTRPESSASAATPAKPRAVRNWAEAIAQVRSVYGAAWPDLSDAVWEKLVRRGYRANAQGIPEVDADPLIGEPLRDTADRGAGSVAIVERTREIPVLAIRGEHSDILSTATLARMRAKTRNSPRSPWPIAAMRRSRMNPGASPRSMHFWRHCRALRTAGCD